MHNLLYALRTLAKSPGFAFTAILTLAVGIGASTAIFTTVDAVLLHPLPYPNASQLVQVTKNMPKFELFKSDASALDFIDYRDLSRSFSHMAAMQTNSVNLTGDAEPVRVSGLRVSTSLFPMLGVQPIEGRVFRPEEEQLGKNRVAVLGEGLWKSRFGADPHIIGKQIEIDTQKFTVIGVVEPVLQFMEQAQLYVPLAFTPAQLDPNARGHQNTDVVARLKSGVTLDRARSEMKLVAARMTRTLPDWYPPDWNIELDPLADSVAGELRTPLLVLLGAVGMVLLIGCVNVANLLLARATARQKEIGLRIALGAGRARIVRQLLTESLLLAAISGAAGMAIGGWVLELFIRFGSPQLLRWQTVRINAPAVLFAVAAAILTSLVFGLAPALSASQLRPAHRSRSSNRLRSPASGLGGGAFLHVAGWRGPAAAHLHAPVENESGLCAGPFADRAYPPAAAPVSQSVAHHGVLLGTAGRGPGAARRCIRRRGGRPAVWRGGARRRVSHWRPPPAGGPAFYPRARWTACRLARAATAAISRLPAAPGRRPRPCPM